MSFLVDTNIISELRKRDRANANVRAWFASVTDDDLFLSVLVIGEIRQGIERVVGFGNPKALGQRNSIQAVALPTQLAVFGFMIPNHAADAPRHGMHPLVGAVPAKCRQSDVRRPTRCRVPALQGRHAASDNLGNRIESPIAFKQQIFELQGRHLVVGPRDAGRVEPIEIVFKDAASSQEVVVLLGTWTGSQNIEGCDIGIEGAEYPNMFTNPNRCLAREPDDVRKVRRNAVFSAQPGNLRIRLGMVLGLVGSE